MGQRLKDWVLGARFGPRFLKIPPYNASMSKIFASDFQMMFSR